MGPTTLGASFHQALNTASHRAVHLPLPVRRRFNGCRGKRSHTVDRATSQASSSPSEEDAELQHHLQSPPQEQHLGVDPSNNTHTPSHRPHTHQLAALAFGIAVFGAAAWALVTVWRRKDSRLHSTDNQIGSPVPAEGSNFSRNNAPASLGEARGRILCRNFARFGTCKYGDKCRFKHERGAEALAIADVQELADPKRPRRPPQRERAALEAESQLKCQGTYSVPYDQIEKIGNLMGYRGTNINAITRSTGSVIKVPKGRDLGKPVIIEILAPDEVALQTVQSLIAQCFETTS